MVSKGILCAFNSLQKNQQDLWLWCTWARDFKTDIK